MKENAILISILQRESIFIRSLPLSSILLVIGDNGWLRWGIGIRSMAAKSVYTSRASELEGSSKSPSRLNIYNHDRSLLKFTCQNFDVLIDQIVF